MSDLCPVYLVDGSRTPFLNVNGLTGSLQAADLAVLAARPLLLRQAFSADALDEVIFGCMMPSLNEANIARIIALRLGCGEAMPAFTVQRNCASGLQAIDSACRQIAHGHSHLILAGGTEAMSHAPLLLSDDMKNWLAVWQQSHSFREKLKTLWELRSPYFSPINSLQKGLTDPSVGLSMGQTAENLAWRFQISRQRMDTYALHSHKRLIYAQSQGLLEELETIFDPSGNLIKRDNGLGKDSSIETLSKLKAAFDPPYGQVTAGNSAAISDGAACVILASEAAVAHFKLPVLARLYPAHWAGVKPEQMGLGPVHAIAGLLNALNLPLDAIDYWELNEAFSAQILACVQALNDESYCQNTLHQKQVFGAIPLERLNIDGGSISLGHPVGASGARIVLHLAHILKRKQAELGIATLCIGGGQGGAMLLENIEGNLIKKNKKKPQAKAVDELTTTDQSTSQIPKTKIEKKVIIPHNDTLSEHKT